MDNKNINYENLKRFKKNIDNVIGLIGKDVNLPIASTDTLGGIKPDNDTNFVDEKGVLRVAGFLNKIMLVPSTNNSFIYDGTEHTPVWDNYDEDMLEIGGTISATNAGDYTTTFIPKEKYIWNDGTTKEKCVLWNVGRISLIIPSKKSNLTYTGSEQSPEWENYDSDKITISGTANAVMVGVYTTIFTPKENYQWSDGTITPKSIEWSIEKAIVSLPIQSGTLIYSGEELSPIWSNYNDTELTISETIVGINASTYTAAFTPKEGYMWNDNTTETKSVNWVINRASISIPSQSGSLTYTGSAQSPIWSNYDSNKMTISGVTSGTNASSYTSVFTPKGNYQWSDGTISDKIVTWSIGKAVGSLSLGKTSVTLNTSTLTTAVAVTRLGDGAITATSGNTSIATVSVSGTTLTITAKAKGTVTITVKVAEGTNHNAPANKTIKVTVDLPSTTLNDNTPAEIQKIAKSGTAANYWSVGDKIGIKLNGTVGELTFNNETYYAYIIGFNHNSSLEGNNTIHFQFGKDNANVNIAFVDEDYNMSNMTSLTFTSGFIMNPTATNIGGWENSYMRNTICSAFLKAMPTEWQNIITACTKYTDNIGGEQSVTNNATVTLDKIWLLGASEVFVNPSYINENEKTYQQRYTFYSNGNSKIKYCHKNNNQHCYWWIRSLIRTNNRYFACVDHTTNNFVQMIAANSRMGFAPGFMVA